jgi:integrase
MATGPVGTPRPRSPDAASVRGSGDQWCRWNYVFGDEIGEQIRDVKRAWQTAVLKAQGHGPTWVWAKGRSKKGSGRLSPESQEAYRAINLHLHDLRHEAGSRPLEAGWPLHQVQHMLGHANIQQTSTYLDATLRGLHRL